MLPFKQNVMPENYSTYNTEIILYRVQFYRLEVVQFNYFQQNLKPSF